METPINKALAEIKERADKATEGPWFNGYWSGQCLLHHEKDTPWHPGPPECVYTYRKITDNEHFKACVSAAEENVNVISNDQVSLRNAVFIAHARQDIPMLLSALEIAIEALRNIEAHKGMTIMNYSQEFMEGAHQANCDRTTDACVALTTIERTLSGEE
jgi:hypothetical protein